MARRIVITGMGWVTPLGRGLDEVWNSLLQGRTAMAPVKAFDASTFATNFAAEAADIGPPPRGLPDHFVSRSTRMALAAAQDAWDRSGLGVKGKVDLRRIGIYLGAGEGEPDFDNFVRTNLAAWNAETRRIEDAAWWRASEQLLTEHREVEQEPCMTAAHIAEALGCRGPSFNCMTACAAGTQAVGEAFEIIRRGDADAMLAGGSHSMIHPLGMTGFIRLTAMSKRRESPATAARPFDATRDGFVMGEGAGMLVLEALEHAMARGAQPLCEVVGYGSSADAFRITDIQPDGLGAQVAMTAALRQAGIDPREPGPDGRPPVHYISAHGTGTQENDKIETAAVRAVFGSLAGKIPFSSVKSMMGHLIQAAGAVELMTCVMAIRTGFVPPTVNLHQPDPNCDLDYIPNVARDLRPAGGVDVCISNGFGFGGQNDSVAVRAFRD